MVVGGENLLITVATGILGYVSQIISYKSVFLLIMA